MGCYSEMEKEDWHSCKKDAVYVGDRESMIIIHRDSPRA